MSSLARVMRGKKVYMGVKRSLRNGILQTLKCGSETWTWNGARQSKVNPMGITYLRTACGVTRC